MCGDLDRVGKASQERQHPVVLSEDIGMETDNPLFPRDPGEPPQQEIPDSPTSIAFPDDDADLSPLGCGISMVARDGDELLFASGRASRNCSYTCKILLNRDSARSG